MSADVAASMDVADDLSALRSDWERLAAAAGTPFATWAWADAWWRQWGGPGRLAVRTCRHADGSPAAILPLCRAGRGPLRALRFIGHGPGDELGPVCGSADRPLAVRALSRALGAERCVMLAERLPEEDGWAALLDGVVIAREPSPVLALHGDWDDYLAARSRNFRQNLRRRERALGRTGAVRFRLTEDAARLARDLDAVFELHAARFGARSSFLGARTRAFHHDLAARALADGWLRLWTLELEGRPAAAWYGFRTSGREWYYQAGWDPARARDGIGLVMLGHTVREAMRDGMREYRFLRGGEAYKARFGAREAQLVTVGLASGPAGRALVAGARAILAAAPGSVPRRVARRVAARAGWDWAT